VEKKGKTFCKLTEEGGMGRGLKVEGTLHFVHVFHMGEKKKEGMRWETGGIGPLGICYLPSRRRDWGGGGKGRII